MRRTSSAVAALGVMIGGLAHAQFPAPPILAVNDVPVGATGIWRTCVEGTAVTEFPMRVVGLMHNSIYPGAPVILCEALDARNRHSGPVAGMSGSPVYIDGKIIGAYAYGPVNQRDQALFMATPIEAMIKMQQLPVGAVAQLPGGSGGRQFSTALAPVAVAGAGPAARAWLAEQLEPYGIMVVEGGNAGVTNIETELVPGSPVAGVIVHGDISAAAVGTVSYRDGNTILAFGHPFLQCGAIEMPMAAAQILAVSHSFVRSYKMSNTGPIIGTIHQDRSPAVVGTIGRIPPMVEVTVRTQHPVLGEKVYRSRGLRHERFTPMVIMYALMDPLETALDASRIRTTRYMLEMTFDSGEKVGLTNVIADGGEGMAVINLMGVVRNLLQNEFAPAALNAFEITLAFDETVQRATITRAWLDRTTVAPGEDVTVNIEMQPYQAPRVVCTAEVRVPADARPGEYTIQVCDAARAEERDGVQQMRPTSLAGMYEVARRRRRADCVYVRLTAAASGLVVGSQAMPSLPPSAVARWRAEASVPLADVMLAETIVPAGAVVRGYHQLNCSVK